MTMRVNPTAPSYYYDAYATFPGRALRYSIT